MDDEDATALIFGSAVAARVRQLLPVLKEETPDIIAGLAAQQVWKVCITSGDPIRGLDEFLDMEASLWM